ncbi:hypothetical protein BKI52_18910 [marine bacterium AO1-C]|nr:hypothetical protein BKI52_18910 [marine bacterium AO1-C]
MIIIHQAFRRSLFLFGILFPCIVLAQSNPTIELSDGQLDYSIGTQMSVFETSNENLTIDQITSATYDTSFKVSRQKLFIKGHSANYFWVKIKVQNKSTLDKWLLELAYPTLDYVDFYFYNGEKKQWQTVQTGDFRPFDNRPIHNRHYVFPLDFSQNKTQYFYLKVWGDSTIQLPLAIYSPDYYFQKASRSDVVHGLLFGVLCLILAHSIFLYFSLKDLSYLYYVVFIIGSLLYFSAESGYSFQYLWTGAYWVNRVLPVGLTTMMIGGIAFAIRFLEIKKYQTILWRIAQVLLVLSAVYLVLSFFLRFKFIIQLIGYTVVFTPLIMISSGIISWRKGHLAARYFTIAWVVYLTGIVLQFLRDFGFISGNYVLTNTTEFAAAIEIMLLSMALGDKYNIFKKEKEGLATEMIKLKEEEGQRLEGRIQERTAKLVETNEMLNQTVDELDSTNDRLNRINITLGKKNADITESIQYAQFIQSSLLPSTQKLTNDFANSFVLFCPKDIVSGDFYWLGTKSWEGESYKLLILADCTGHGVPGAFMTILASSLIHEIIQYQDTVDPSTILHSLDKKISETLQTQSNTRIHDGMDLSLIVIRESDQKLTFAGAKAPLYYVRDGVFHQIKGSIFPIGGSNQYKKPKSFQAHELQLSSGDMLYLTSDGFQDQFGGPEGRKYLKKHFRNFLLKISQLPSAQQHNYLHREFRQWKGSNKQTDDITIIGIKID